jgi:putative tryptophan/tyrosine transport system substrate-binding protein
VREKVDVILAGGSLGAEAAKKATSDIPIVDLVELGIVTSLARPGGNLIGFIVNAPETAAKSVQIIKEIKPNARRVTAIWNPASSSVRLESREAKNFAAANDIAIALHDARTADELKNALANDGFRASPIGDKPGQALGQALESQSQTDLRAGRLNGPTRACRCRRSSSGKRRLSYNLG